MDTKALLKLLVCALLAGGTAAGGSFIADQPLAWSSIASTVVAACVAFLQKSPLVKE